MPNYNLVIDSTFQPFSFERYIQPYQIYGEAYKETEQAYSDLVQQTEAWKNIATQENSPEAYAMYKKYSDELNAVVEDFSRGMTAKNKSQLTGLKARYASEITPIATAANQLKALKEERAKQELADPSLRYERAIEDINLDKLIKDPFINYGKSYSGTLIENQALKAASALSKTMRENPSQWKSILGGQYYQQKIQKGYTPEEVLLASIGDPNAPEALQNIMNSAIQNSGIESWEGFYDNNGNITSKGNQLLQDVRNFASRGLTGAIGGIDYNIRDNKEWEYNKKLEIERAKNDIDIPEDPKKNPPLDPTISPESVRLSKKFIEAFGENLSLPENLIYRGHKARELSPLEQEAIIMKYNTDWNPFQPYPYIPYTEKVFINPIAEYENRTKGIENYEDYLAKTYGYDKNTNPYTRQMNAELRRDLFISGPSPVLTMSQYEALKELGYDANSTEEDFAQLSSRINERITSEAPININLSSYESLENRLLGILNEDNINSIVSEYTGTKDTGKEVPYDELFNINKNGTVTIKNKINIAGVDPKKLDHLLIVSGGKKYSIDSEALGYGISKLLSRSVPGSNITYKDAYNKGTKEQKEEILQYLSFIYQKEFNSEIPVQPKTSSKAEYGTYN